MSDREQRLEQALLKTMTVIRNVEILFHPKYLLYTDTLLKECEEALAKQPRSPVGASD